LIRGIASTNEGSARPTLLDKGYCLYE
jgi:hypothetical protein